MIEKILNLFRSKKRRAIEKEAESIYELFTPEDIADVNKNRQYSNTVIVAKDVSDKDSIKLLRKELEARFNQVKEDHHCVKITFNRRGHGNRTFVTVTIKVSMKNLSPL